MALYYALVFGILVTEMTVFVVLALPIPSRFRRHLTVALVKPFQLTQVQVATKCVLAFILLLFIDTINRVYNVERELRAAGLATGAQDRVEIQSRKFYAQRNMYLTGITLFLTFAVVRTLNIVWELLGLKDEYRAKPADPAKPAQRDTAALAAQIADIDKQIAQLKEQAEKLQAGM